MPNDPPADLTDRLRDFIDRYYRDEVGKLAQHYPNEQASLFVSWRDIHTFDIEVAED